MRSFAMAVITATGLALAGTSGAFATPITSIGKAADTIDARAMTDYYGTEFRP